MGTRAPVRGACVSAIAIGARGAEGTRKKLRAAALAFPTAAAPLISPKLCGPPTGLPILQCFHANNILSMYTFITRACKADEILNVKIKTKL